MATATLKPRSQGRPLGITKNKSRKPGQLITNEPIVIQIKSARVQTQEGFWGYLKEKGHSVDDTRNVTRNLIGQCFSREMVPLSAKSGSDDFLDSDRGQITLATASLLEFGLKKPRHWRDLFPGETSGLSNYSPCSILSIVQACTWIRQLDKYLGNEVLFLMTPSPVSKSVHNWVLSASVSTKREVVLGAKEMTFPNDIVALSTLIVCERDIIV